ncbi:MAG: hypothetical protein E6K80_03475 [Candidatus Eisenbacteria bacterium]|uniref:PEGA domain-containing protein n=1 Tax=Eiseniibacteriota bacterium TaxID=2212470 RepID=A0A538U8D9_UNCEI|nr:MAG: hypothetical protein E6K80_03475 [Candidatus Eisenbacteria bacterium]
MSLVRWSRCLSVGMCALALLASIPPSAHGDPASTPAAATSSAATEPVAVVLDHARGSIKDGDYDGAIGLLKPLLERERSHPDSLRDVYLLLIKTYVFIGNANRFKPQGLEVSNLNYQEARKLIRDCLSVRELRHTRAEPDSEFPPEMLSTFAEVRGQMFGSFRILGLEPPTSVVLLDGVALQGSPRRGTLGEADLPVGTHVVAVRAKGYTSLTERVVISPGARLERPYRLTRKRTGWYAAGSALAVTGLVVALRSGKSGGPTQAALQPLPSAPPPPGP